MYLVVLFGSNTPNRTYTNNTIWCPIFSYLNGDTCFIFLFLIEDFVSFSCGGEAHQFCIYECKVYYYYHILLNYETLFSAYFWSYKEHACISSVWNRVHSHKYVLQVIGKFETVAHPASKVTCAPFVDSDVVNQSWARYAPARPRTCLIKIIHGQRSHRASKFSTPGSSFSTSVPAGCVNLSVS